MIQTKSGDTSSSQNYTAVNFAGITSVSNVASLAHNFGSTSWIIDTGATDHMASNQHLFASIHTLKHPIKVGFPEGSQKLVKHAGTVHLTPHIIL